MQVDHFEKEKFASKDLEWIFFLITARDVYMFVQTNYEENDANIDKV